MELVSFHLPINVKREEIEDSFNITFKKGIEATFYAIVDDMMITYTKFNVLTLINYSRSTIVENLQKLEIEDAELFDQKGFFQDYPIVIDPELLTFFQLDNNTITLQSYNPVTLIIVAHVMSQSVALELYEEKLSDYYEKSRKLIDAADTFSMFKRARLARFAKELVLIRHDMLIELHLLDKPNILWDNERVEDLYNALASILELKDRFDTVEYKLNNIKDDIVMVMDLTNHNHSSFLEWIIIILIVVEILMGFYEWFGPSLH